MPMSDLDIPLALRQLTILDEDDQLDDALLPDLGAEQLRSMHRTMVTSRQFDERRLKLQKQGRIGTFAPAIGQEGAQIGAICTLRSDDWFVPSYRDVTMALWRGAPMSGLLLYDAGYNEGAEPAGDHDLPIAVPVSSQIQHAAGLGYAAKLRQTGEVVLVVFGDGATSEGDFHEAVNFAAVHALPVIFLCQNNQYAISTPLASQTASRTIVQKAVAYGIPGIQVDGNDVFASYAGTLEAVERARAGDGPTLIEAVTYRMSVHTTADDPSTYRDEEEEAAWRGKDPILRFQRHLIDRGVLTDDDVAGLEREVGEEITRAWEETRRQMEEIGDPIEMFDHVYATRPDFLEEQREAFKQGQRAHFDG